VFVKTKKSFCYRNVFTISVLLQRSFNTDIMEQIITEIISAKKQKKVHEISNLSKKHSKTKVSKTTEQITNANKKFTEEKDSVLRAKKQNVKSVTSRPKQISKEKDVTVNKKDKINIFEQNINILKFIGKLFSIFFARFTKKN
jgi:exonuclease VII large subunit